LTDRYGKTYQGYGGDFGDRPCDYSFSGNGIVYGDDRMPSPKMQEVKYDYQAIRISFDGNEAVIANRNLFTNTDAYDCLVTLKQEGRLIKQAKCPCSVVPLSEGRLALPFDVPADGKEYVVTVSFCLKEDTCWAEQGYEIAFDKLMSTVENNTDTPVYLEEEEPPREEKKTPEIQPEFPGGIRSRSGKLHPGPGLL
jgi:beta-galactosidase